ncbi:hypothetical protein PPACK8108_LOCUS14739 [Phakopsora pachyrhizi]|uniref:AAA ATPase AAA+ lid domain-containing protein n=1 Tax=Phakopsora pachyrhizi TaxID=170000 RepID=A0AAV0B6Q4_PHAPC|nr:hypothetical protein PPACK8108_LOCUS14739 [Phakopsora pachyrhizi]
MKLADDVDLDKIEADTHGYVGSNAASLCSEASMQQIREKMKLINLDKDTIKTDVLDSLGIRSVVEMSSINSEIKKNPSTTPARSNSSSIFSSSLIGNSTGTNLPNSQFSNYLNIPRNNTLGHLPHKPGPSLTTINTTNTNKRGSSIVTGVLSPNANQSTLSPNSIGFGKKSPQLFGRVRLTDINPTPNLSLGGITNNNILVHLILLLSERLWWKFPWLLVYVCCCYGWDIQRF